MPRPTAPYVSPAPRSPLRRRAGYMFLEMLVSLMLLAVLAAALTVATHSTSDAARRLAESRRCVRRAEAVLTSLQSGRPVSPENAADERMTIEALPDDGPLPGTRWVRVTASAGRSKAELIGAVPASAAVPATAPTR